MHFPTKKEVEVLKAKGNIIPVYRKVSLGDETPISVIEKLDGDDDDFFLLESGKGPENIARYSFLGYQPFMTFRSKGNEVRIKKEDETLEFNDEKPLEVLKEIVDKYNPVKIDGLPKFHGGGIGYYSYDVGRFFEELPVDADDDLEIPEIFFVFTDTVIVFDHFAEELIVVSNLMLGDGQEDVEKLYTRAIESIDLIIKQIEENEYQDEIREFKDLTFNEDDLDYNASFTRDGFADAVRQAKEYIKAGDIFQVNLSVRVDAPVTEEPFTIYKVLRKLNPSPYMAYLNFGELQIVSSSPELLVRSFNGEVETRPIAGTRPRGKTPEETQALADELINHPKERAEHIMLVDLERNDLGRVADYGTVEVDELMVIEEYSHVIHIVSNVKGKLHQDKDRFDILRGVFPGGTITGAPKVRTMEIIEELEPVRRGPYTGAIGFLGFGEEMELNIVIRTMVIKNGRAYVQAGAGIVDDSIPENEYEESLKKAEALLKTITIVEEGDFNDSDDR
ncbi:MULTISPECIES: anthranilate synthase component I [unclassified Candidatus Frackibacter]|uniref:anthranilate synthase component I n=1 Tax=unclassified Candidatus Frackibacter TaxID=2648818 RepID=UPI000797936A|nr:MULTISPECIES: anthranilate synthase component I [unclassified Candidatus Frackibacter]KXS41323.1 MAG: anthranilate synthase component I [Candidatus Frackibacter sp. T328-2]SEM64954.1 aminodeoxychorismate synthase, subunit I [Candidatus Frackibacter sp. WG12]SFL67476.1 aminodeoxychorismate synthase, subunit I [Candidatus Frackibacter sp. WG13]